VYCLTCINMIAISEADFQRVLEIIRDNYKLSIHIFSHPKLFRMKRFQDKTNKHCKINKLRDLREKPEDSTQKLYKDSGANSVEVMGAEWVNSDCALSVPSAVVARLCILTSSLILGAVAGQSVDDQTLAYISQSQVSRCFRRRRRCHVRSRICPAPPVSRLRIDNYTVSKKTSLTFLTVT